MRRFFVAHGDRDPLVTVEGARLFVKRLRSTSSNPVVYAELPGAQHSFDLFHFPPLRYGCRCDRGLRRLGAVDAVRSRGEAQPT
jgi:acetyl esterase/lipase